MAIEIYDAAGYEYDEGVLILKSNPDNIVIQAMAIVCRDCPLKSECEPEYSESKGWFNIQPVKVTGCKVHTNECRLKNKFIPDRVFRNRYQGMIG